MLAGVRYANDQKGWFQWHSFMNDFTHLALSWKKLNCEIWRNAVDTPTKKHTKTTSIQNLSQGTMSCISMSCLQELRWTATAGTGLCPMPCWHVFKKELPPTNNKNNNRTTYTIHSTMSLKPIHRLCCQCVHFLCVKLFLLKSVKMPGLSPKDLQSCRCLAILVLPCETRPNITYIN